MVDELLLGERRLEVELPSNRTPAGMSRKSSSTEETPIVASISSRSASVSDR